jgi:hemoglobin
MPHQDATETSARPSLYDRLGGVYNIAPVVDDLIDRIMVDQRLNANPRVDEAHHRVSAAGFKYFVTEMLCEAAGGPQRYSGRPMGDSHRHLMITEEEWLTFMDDLQQTLTSLACLNQSRMKSRQLWRVHTKQSWWRRFRNGQAPEMLSESRRRLLQTRKALPGDGDSRSEKRPRRVV